jgi:serine/threonine protein phosphatase PrpC
VGQAGGRLLVANVGDSRWFLGRVDAAGAASAVPLTRDHKPDAPAEAARIRAHQARRSLAPGVTRAPFAAAAARRLPVPSGGAACCSAQGA